MTERKRLRLIESYDWKLRREQRKAEKLFQKLEKVRNRISVIVSIQTSLTMKDYK